MTTTFIAAVATLDDPTLHARAAALQAEFDAIRPACPPWCTGDCNDGSHFGDAVMHEQAEAEVPCMQDRLSDPAGVVTVRAYRVDSFEDGAVKSWPGIDLAVDRSGSVMGDEAQLSASQARKLAAELLNAADRLDPAPPGEAEVVATDVKVGDFYNVDGEWLYVYSVGHDDPSKTVDIFTTVERGEWPEPDYEEKPHRFAPTDWVRVRRGLRQCGDDRGRDGSVRQSPETSPVAGGAR